MASVAQMHLAFKEGLDKLDSQFAANILPEEIDLQLNRAQERWIKQRLFKNNGRRTGFEEDQKRTDDLRIVLKKGDSGVNMTITQLPDEDVDNITTHSFSVSLPDDYQFHFRSYSIVTNPICGIETKHKAKNRLTTHDRIDLFLDDPFNGPVSDELPILFEGNNIIVYTDPNTTLNSFHMIYTRIPRTINIFAGSPTGDCELPIHTHNEIVDLAVSNVLEIIQSERYQTNKSELAGTE